MSNGIRHTGQISSRGDEFGVDKYGFDEIGVGDEVVDGLTGPRRVRVGVKSEDINRRTALKSEKMKFELIFNFCHISISTNFSPRILFYYFLKDEKSKRPKFDIYNAINLNSKNIIQSLWPRNEQLFPFYSF